jgi:exodeoxyribonuclease VII small subunit
MPKSSAPKAIDEMTYESAFIELQSIVTALENEPRTLDDAMSLFERGQALVKRCTELLDKAELKVKRLSGDDLVDFPEE